MILPIYTAIEKLDPALIEAAKDLGAGDKETFYESLYHCHYLVL